MIISYKKHKAIVDAKDKEIKALVERLKKSDNQLIERTSMLTAMVRSLKASQNVTKKTEFLRNRFTMILKKKEGALEYIMGDDK